jgi:molybdate transport system substrate-binding protein
MRTWSKLTALFAVGGLAVSMAGAAVPAAEITVATSGGPVPDVMRAVVEAFERETGHKVTLVSRRGEALTDDVKQGNVDLVIWDAAVVTGFVESGDVIAASNTPVMTSKIGIAVKAGAPKPDIRTAESLRAALLEAKNVGYSQFASGQIFLRAVERLGITEAVTAKAVIPQSGPVGALVASGEAELGVQQVAELLAVPGIDLVGPLPDDLQEYLPTSAGIPTQAKDAETAQALIAFLRSAPARAILQEKGMDVP